MIAYAITDPSTLNFNTLASDLERFSKQASMIVYRDKFQVNYAHNAQKFIDETKKHHWDKVLLHSDIALAKKLGADGVHLTSEQFGEIEEAKKYGLFIVMSTHSIFEAKKAALLGVDMITYSPIFETPGKGEPVGLDRLRELTLAVSIPVIALGGILTDEQIDVCKMSSASGFASIRYFI